MRACSENLTAGVLAAVLIWANPLACFAADVSAHTIVATGDGAVRARSDTNVVVWLTPVDPVATAAQSAQPALPHATLLQKNKAFDPHILAVHVGSQVDFPNHEPFFHNVFSLFNGKRFDLGLYEAGSTRGVHFDRVGICYIFCNIHPQMSAVIVVVDTPYFAVSDSQGKVSIPHVPSGRYQVKVWEEHCDPDTLAKASRQVAVGEEAMSLGDIRLQESNQSGVAHSNKYGKAYDPDVYPGPIYVNP